MQSPAAGRAYTFGETEFIAMKVQDLIMRDLVTAEPHDTLASIEERMADRNVHALPVLDDDGKAVGIVTSSDFTPDLDMGTSVADLMSDMVYEIDLGEEAREAARRMHDLGVHHLVATERGRAVGMLSSFDLLRVIIEG